LIEIASSMSDDVTVFLGEEDSEGGLVFAVFEDFSTFRLFKFFFFFFFAKIQKVPPYLPSFFFGFLSF